MRQPKNVTVNAPYTIDVLCVDLDNSLIRTDSLLESILRFLKNHPANLFWILVWAFRGKAHLKQMVTQRVHLNPADLPYDPELVAFLKAERIAGSRIVLATGAHHQIADGVAAHLQIFDEVIASDETTNLTPGAKVLALVDRFGARGFRYVGNSRADLPIWRQASSAIVFGSGGSLPRRLEREGIITQRDFTRPVRRAALLAQALRVYQWPKNLLIWLPQLLSHRIGEPLLFFKGLVAMISFSFCASALYLVNDLLDLPADRAHPRKCARPFASGNLDLRLGILLAPLLTATALVMAWLLSPAYLLVLGLYAAASIAYSFVFKGVPLLDVFLLGALYVVRIFAGGAAMGIRITSWTMGYCMFLFLSLALLKRYVEVLMLSAKKQSATPGRGYCVVDEPILACFGAGAACVAALLLALYIESPEVRLLYQHPERLWLLCGVHLYWISRVWLLANRGEMHHDPVLFALRDRTSYWLGLAAAGVALLATK